MQTQLLVKVLVCTVIHNINEHILDVQLIGAVIGLSKAVTIS